MSTLKSSAEDLTLNADGSGNDIILQSNGSTLVTVDGSNSRVGIGTATPSQPLEVRKDQNGNTVAQIYNATAGTGAMAQVRVKSNSGLGILANLDDGYSSTGIYQAGTTTLFAASASTGGLLLGTESDHPIRFYQGAAEKCRITSAGLTFGGDTAAANALDDYEEGTWTPAYSATGLSVSYNTQVGKYTKIGRLVTVSMVLVISSSSGNSASESIKVTGLPFTAGSSAGGARAAAAYGWDADKPDVGQISGTEVLFIDSSGNWCNSDSLQTSNDRGHMYFNFSYQTS